MCCFLQELTRDKGVLETQVCEHMNTISTLRSEISQLKIGGGGASGDDVNEQLQQLRQLLHEQQQQTESREKQVREKIRSMTVNYPHTFLHYVSRLITEFLTRAWDDAFLTRIG